MEENKFLRFCPKHGNQGEAALTCPECGQETVLSDVTRDEYGEWLFSSDDREKLYPYFIQKAFKVGLDKILADLRSGKKGKVEKAVELLTWRPEKEDYISEVVPWWGVSAPKQITLFLSRCSYESVRPYLDFKHYDYFDKNSVKLFMPLFLERYKHSGTLPCEKCKKETSNLFIKIVSHKNVISTVRHVGYITEKLEYEGFAVPHAYCDECALKLANKEKKLRDLSDREKIEGFMHLNSDANIRSAGDMGRMSVFGNLQTDGFNYEDLVSPDVMERLNVTDPNDRAVIAGMMECAFDVKGKLDSTD